MTWVRLRLGELGTWHGGGTPSKAQPEFWADGDIPWLSPKDMGADVLRGTQDHVTAAALLGSSTKLVPSGSVAIVVRSGILERLLPIALVPFATTLNQDMKALSPRPGVDARWVAWGLRSIERDLLEGARKSGTTVASLEWSRFLSFELPVPPLDEQHRIVAVLEDHLSRLDAATGSMAAASRRAQLVAESALQSALKNKQAESVALVHLIGAKLANGRSVPSRDGGFPVLRLTALGGRFIDLNECKGGEWRADEARPFLVTAGDLLVSRGNGSLKLVARGGIVPDDPRPVAYPDTMIRVRPDLAKVRADYLAVVWNSQVIRKQIEASVRTTAGIYKVNQQQLGNIRVPVLPVVEQKFVAAEVQAAEDAQARLIAAMQRASRDAGALRRSLLTAAFRGDLAR